MEVLYAFLGFVLVATITPGPNNLLLASSGIRFGVWRTVPHVLGIHCGIYAMVALSGLGLGQVLLGSPMALAALKVFGSGYLAYLAWKIIGFRLAPGTESAIESPMSMVQATLFQFTNPKAWMMATTGLNITFGFNQGMVAAALLLCLGFATLGALCNFAWVWFGASLSGLLAEPLWRRCINGGLAALTALTIVLFWAA